MRDEAAGGSRIVAAAVGTLAVLAYAVFAAVQILVLNPLAAVPGRSLAQIYADLDAAGQSMMPHFAIGVPLIGVALAVALGITVVMLRWKPRHVVLGYLALLTPGSMAFFVASFGAGMSMADTYMISGADTDAWALPLHLTSAAAVVLLVCGLVADEVLTRRQRAGDHTPWTAVPR